MRERPELPASDDEGFSLVEVVVAMVVFAIMVSAALGIVIQTFDVTRDNAHRVAAGNLATKQIEATRSRLAIDILDGLSSRTEQVAGTTYTIEQNANFVTSGSDTSLCESSGGQLAYKLVTVEVTWEDMGTVEPVRADTVKALGVGDEGLDEALGTMAVGVTNASGDPVAGVVVTLMPGGLTRTTGIDGCAVFVNLAVDPGGTDYTASVNQLSYVSTINRQSTQAVQGVLAGQIAQADLLYDVGRTLDVVVEAPAGYTAPLGMPLSFRNSYVDAGATLPDCATADPGQGCTTGGQARNLFPAAYDLWASECPSPRPEGATGSVDLTTGAGSVTVPLEGLWVHVVDSFDAPLAGYTVTAGGACSGAGAYVLPTTAGDGSRGALPAGSWDVTVTSPTGDAYVQSVTLAPPADPGDPVAELRFVIPVTP